MARLSFQFDNDMNKRQIKQLLKTCTHETTQAEANKEELFEAFCKALTNGEVSFEEDTDIEEESSSDSLEEQLAKKGIYYIYDIITSDTMFWIQQDLLLKLNSGWNKEITLYLNTSGGDTREAWAIIDLLRLLNVPVKTVAIGGVLSAGVTLLACGTRGKRYITSNTEVMYHQFSASMEGKSCELKAAAVSMTNEEKRDIRFWLTQSNFTSEEEIKQFLVKDVDAYLTPEETIQYGIADHILGDISFPLLKTSRKRKK